MYRAQDRAAAAGVRLSLDPVQPAMVYRAPPVAPEPPVLPFGIDLDAEEGRKALVAEIEQRAALREQQSFDNLTKERSTP